MHNPPQKYPHPVGSTTGKFFFTAEPAVWAGYKFVQWEIVVCEDKPIIKTGNPLEYDYDGKDPVVITPVFENEEGPVSPVPDPAPEPEKPDGQEEEKPEEKKSDCFIETIL